MKAGLWRTGRECCGLMRQKSIGLGQMGRYMFGSNEGNYYQTRLLYQLSSMEGGIT